MTRRRRGWRSRRPWLEPTLVVLGCLFAAAAVASAVVTIYLLAHIGETETGLVGGTLGTTSVARTGGIILFALLTAVTSAVAWWLLAEPVRTMLARRRGEEE